VSLCCCQIFIFSLDILIVVLHMLSLVSVNIFCFKLHYGVFYMLLDFLVDLLYLFFLYHIFYVYTRLKYFHFSDRTISIKTVWSVELIQHVNFRLNRIYIVIFDSFSLLHVAVRKVFNLLLAKFESFLKHVNLCLFHTYLLIFRYSCIFNFFCHCLAQSNFLFSLP